MYEYELKNSFNVYKFYIDVQSFTIEMMDIYYQLKLNKITLELEKLMDTLNFFNKIGGFESYGMLEILYNQNNYSFNTDTYLETTLKDFIKNKYEYKNLKHISKDRLICIEYSYFEEKKEYIILKKYCHQTDNYFFIKKYKLKSGLYEFGIVLYDMKDYFNLNSDDIYFIYNVCKVPDLEGTEYRDGYKIAKRILKKIKEYK